MVCTQSLAVVASLFATFSHATPVVQEKRQGTGIAIFASIFKNALAGAIQGEQPTCVDGFAGTDPVYYNIGTDGNGNYYLACWQNVSDTMPWTQTEIDVANCLTNLHYEQASVCISVAGSECDLNGYVANGGRQQMMHTLIAAGGSDGAAQLSAQDSTTIQAAIRSLEGQNVKGTGGSGPDFYAVTDESATKAVDYASQLSVNWIGEDEC
ncbi:hypothetical protein PRZ48_006987 [Zasmidium cellare]|uniref:Uncharacterized protein n=1 Tax=Zasmidium cellare TaxID=395010 RepID=A0ABR0EI36_ZASCE|nr:hypothetical protein PRZ48_006987 [Zasmidium cellare]